jgi:hypothetical protein
MGVSRWQVRIVLLVNLLHISHRLRSEAMALLSTNNYFVFKLPASNLQGSATKSTSQEDHHRLIMLCVEDDNLLWNHKLAASRIRVRRSPQLEGTIVSPPLNGLRVGVREFLMSVMEVTGTSEVGCCFKHTKPLEKFRQLLTLRDIHLNVFIALSVILRKWPRRKLKECPQIYIDFKGSVVEARDVGTRNPHQLSIVHELAAQGGFAFDTATLLAMELEPLLCRRPAWNEEAMPQSEMSLVDMF